MSLNSLSPSLSVKSTSSSLSSTSSVSNTSSISNTSSVSKASIITNKNQKKSGNMNSNMNSNMKSKSINDNISVINGSRSENSDRSDNSGRSENSINGSNKDNMMVVYKKFEDSDEVLMPIEQITSDVIREKYPKLPKEQAIEELNKLIELWINNLNKDSSLQKILIIGLTNFGMGKNGREINMENIKKGYRHCVYRLLTLYNYFRKNKLIKERHPTTNQEYYIIFNKLSEIIYYTEQTVRGGLRMRLVLDEGYESSMNDDIGLFKFSEINISDNTPYQNLILFLLRKLHEGQLRRYKECIYEMVFNKKGQFTYSWKEHTSIKNFVYKCTNKEENYDMWRNATKSKSNIKDAISYLEDCDSAEFPELKKKRGVFSFENGIYFINHPDESGKHMDFWHEFGTTPKPPSSIVACRHFNCEFNNYPEIELHEWEKVPTPNFDKIINYQFCKEEQFKEIVKWMYIFIGKMLYPVGELERWQIMPYLHGIAGSGKCFQAGTEIMTFNGSNIKVENVKIGDYLMGDDSTPRKVLGITHGKAPMYDIISNNGEIYTVNGAHILSLKNISNKEHIQDISVDDFIKLSPQSQSNLKGYKAPVLWTYKEVSLDPYLLGHWLGNCNNNCNEIDEYNLRKYNLWNNKHIPDDFLKNSREIQLKVLSGIRNSAGKSKGENDFSIVHSSEKLIDDTIFLCRSLGFDCQKQFDTHKFIIHISNHKLYDIKIVPKEINDYYGFQLDGNQRFLLYNFTVTHNSSICEVIKNIYESRDVGVIENTIEEKFGLAPICDKYLFIAPEIKKNFSLDQALFQKIISGEEVCLPKKNKDPVQVTWNLPGFMASNEAPGFIDASGSISRRLIVFKFLRMISKEMIDPDLILKLKLEIPALIKKSNMAYLFTVNENKSKDLWNIVPTYFHDTREALGRDTNPLKSFLGSGLLRFDKEFFIKEKDFKVAFKDFCIENNIGRVRWTESLYEEPFLLYGNKHGIKLHLEKNASVFYPRINPTKRKFTGAIIFGVEINTPSDSEDPITNNTNDTNDTNDTTEDPSKKIQEIIIT